MAQKEDSPERVPPNWVRPVWAPRVKRGQIARLYALDAKGIQDEDLLDEVAMAFFARIHDCLVYTRALRTGEVICPQCGPRSGSVIQRNGPGTRTNHELLRCSACGWELPWSEYQRSTNKKHLGSLGLRQFFEDFLDAYPRAKGYKEKMLLVDGLLHRYHWELQGDPGGPAAVNLIGGSRDEVFAFLNTLTYGQLSTPDLLETRARWVDLLDYGPWNRETVDELSNKYTSHRSGSSGDLGG